MHMALKLQFSQYTPSKNGHRSIEEAISELQREMDTRKRILDRWVMEGRLSWVDAHDRFERLLSALRLLIAYSNEIDAATQSDDVAEPETNTSATNPIVPMPKGVDEISLDDARSAMA